MELFKIMPLEGIQFKNKIISLSASKQDIIGIMGEPHCIHKQSFYYFNNSLCLDFDENENVEFIEFLNGVNAFQIDAEKLYHILSAQNKGDIQDDENGYSYVFYNISV